MQLVASTSPVAMTAGSLKPWSMLLGLGSDLVVMTGDLVEDVKPLAGWAILTAKRLGKFAILEITTTTINPKSSRELGRADFELRRTVDDA